MATTSLLPSTASSKVITLSGNRLWIPGTALGLILAFILFRLVGSPGPLWQFIAASAPYRILACLGVVCFAPLGILQAIILRQRIKGVGLWLFSTVLGWLLLVGGWELSPLVKSLSAPLGQYVAAGEFRAPFNILLNLNVITAMMFGLVFGCVQWLILRGKITGAYRWILVSVTAYAIGLPIASGIASTDLSMMVFTLSDGIRLTLAGLSGGIIIGAISQFGLNWLLHNQIAVASAVAQESVEVQPVTSVLPKSTITLPKIIQAVLLVVIAIVGLDPLFGIWVERSFPERPLYLNTYSASIGIDSYWKMVHQGLHPVVFTGSSSTFEGVSPHAFDQAILNTTGQVEMSSVDISITGANISQSRDLIRDIIIPRQPTAVFYMTEMRAFTSNDSQNIYKVSPLGYALQMPPGFAKSAGLWLLENSAFARYRNNLFDLLTGNRELNPKGDDLGYIDDRGHYARNEARAAEWSDVQGQATDFINFKISDEHQAALNDIVNSCAGSQTHCIIVIMPIFHTLYEQMRPEEIQIFKNALTNTIGSTQVAIWDFNRDACRDILGIDGFADPVHLNLKGSEKFSQILAALYADQYLGFALPADSPAWCAEWFHN